jgi:hypothetical protein
MSGGCEPTAHRRRQNRVVAVQPFGYRNDCWFAVFVAVSVLAVGCSRSDLHSRAEDAPMSLTVRSDAFT